MYKTLIYDNNTYNDFVIDEYGNIKNLKTNHIYKNSISKSGYYIVYLPLGKRGKVKGIRVHKAVAETFIPNPNNYPIVHHKDENKLNPCVDNLEWTTSKINTHYHLQEMSKITEYYNNRKLCKKDLSFIRLFDGVLNRKELSEMFKVSKTTISNVCNGYSYKND